MKKGSVKLVAERKITPYSVDSQIIANGWLVSSCTDVPTKNAKSLTPFRGWGKAKERRNKGIGKAR